MKFLIPIKHGMIDMLTEGKIEEVQTLVEMNKLNKDLKFDIN